MNLKEAFRFQNKLQSLMVTVEEILMIEDNVIKTQKTYLYKKAMPQASNETVTEVPNTEYYDQINQLTDFLLYLLREHEKLSAIINTVKRSLTLDIDGEISLNKHRQRIADIFRKMTAIRNSEIVKQKAGTGYCFNAEGNQVAYKCDIKTVKTINFDRNKVRRYATELTTKSDSVSAEVDSCMINSVVDYTAPFDVNDSFSDIFDDFLLRYKK
ncbi:MAG: hypothetical protein IJU14_01085 [Clostridia bacterium]|nr:hypothetical protein [Clostridia bacterium]